jgi:hypothetical protein
MGSYSGHITAVEEGTEKVTKIPLQTGAPFVVRLSTDKTRFYVQSANQEHFEIVDVRRRQSLDQFTLGDARRHVRAMAFEVDPQHKTMVLVSRTATKLIDRWEIAGRFISDLATPDPPHGGLVRGLRARTTVRDSVRRRQAVLRLRASHSGLRPATSSGDRGIWRCHEAAAGRPCCWRIDRPTRVRDRRVHDARPDPEPSLLVVGHLDLGARTVETFPLGPAPVGGDVSFTIAPDRSKAHVLHEQIGRHELWTVDMATHRVLSRTPVPSRPRMQVRASSSGQMLYFYEAGRLIDLRHGRQLARCLAGLCVGRVERHDRGTPRARVVDEGRQAAEVTLVDDRRVVWVFRE